MIQELPHLAAEMGILNLAPGLAWQLQPLQCSPRRVGERPPFALPRPTRRAQDAASSRAEGQTLTGQTFAAIGAEIKSGAITQFTQEHKLKMRQARSGHDAWLPQIPQRRKRFVE